MNFLNIFYQVIIAPIEIIIEWIFLFYEKKLESFEKMFSLNLLAEHTTNDEFLSCYEKLIEPNCIQSLDHILTLLTEP